jgi:dihydropyrimidine dehydrogenase (NAD+) subunit PreT
VNPIKQRADIAAGRLDNEAYQRNFADSHPPLSPNEALIESDRCYYCYDAPCVTACPTGIDIPSFIRKIATGNLKGSANDILKENIMGAVCARVCPTEDLCEGACVRTSHEKKPVAIGALQRYATDWLFENNIQLFERAAASGKRVAVVGGGPAGLSCAHRLALLGHAVVVYEAREKLSGLNEYGIAAYKVKDDIAQREVRYLLAVGGIETRLRQALGRDFTLAELSEQYDAVFLSVGLSGVNALGLEPDPDSDRGADSDRGPDPDRDSDREPDPGRGPDSVAGVYDAVDYIERLRQTDDLSTLPVGRRVVVIGGGMTAIDVASQVKRLGAEEVTIVYRRGSEHMGASQKEQNWAQTSGVKIRHRGSPRRLLTVDGALAGVEFDYTQLDGQARAVSTGAMFTLAADMLFKAIGQSFERDELGAGAELLQLHNGRLRVDAERKTSLAKVWAGGDCVADGEDLTVVAVQDGKRAAHSIDRFLRS